MDVAQRSTETKPERCENCELRAPEKLVRAGEKRGAVGIPVAVWLCSECAGAVPRPKRRTTSRRTPVGRYGRELMRVAFRVGGGPASQLGALLLREMPQRFAARKDPLAAAIKAAQGTLPSLRRAGLMRSVGVWREHATGDRDGRTEEYYYLHGEGVLWGGRLNHVEDAKDAREGYKRHQLPRRAEHSAYRNDVFLRLLGDAEETEGVDLRASDLVGESWEEYPYPVGKIVHKPGAEAPARGGYRKYEWLYPDGHPILRWNDGLSRAYDLEAERESGAREAARKIDRYAAYWMRLYRVREREVRKAELAGLRKELARLEAEHRGGTYDPDRVQEIERLTERADEAKETLDEPLPRYLGLPEAVAPVLFVHETRAKSEEVLRALTYGRYPMPRYETLRDYLFARSRGQAPVGGLFVFGSWEEIRPGVEVDLVSGEEYEGSAGRSMEDIYRTLISGPKKVSLREVAEHRRAMGRARDGGA